MRYDDTGLFSQEQVNSINADHKRKAKEAEAKSAELTATLEAHKKELETLRSSTATLSTDRQQMVDQLEELGNTAKLTAEEKTKLQEQIEEERKQGLSDAERMTKSLEKLQIDSQAYRKDSELKYAKLLTQNRSSVFTAAVTTAATRKDQEAFNPDHIVAVLNSHLTWEDDKPIIKNFKVDEDTTGNYTPAEAVKLMATMPEHKPLFRPTGKTGLNSNPENGDHIPEGDLKIEDMSMEDYSKNKEALNAQYDKERLKNG